MNDTHGTGRSSGGSRGCSRRRSTATRARRPAPRSSVHRCSCLVGLCPMSALIPFHLYTKMYSILPIGKIFLYIFVTTQCFEYGRCVGNEVS